MNIFRPKKDKTIKIIPLNHFELPKHFINIPDLKNNKFIIPCNTPCPICKLLKEKKEN